MWNTTDYIAKAKRYIQMGQVVPTNDWQRPFWFSHALEYLVRAAVCKVSPALNADPLDDGNSLLYACGIAHPTEPKTIPVHSVLSRCVRIVPGFTDTIRKQCDSITMLRNREAHSHQLAFDGLLESQWLTRYYEVTEVLLNHLGVTLDDFFGAAEGPSARMMIAAHKSNTTKAVKDKIAVFQREFQKLSEEVRQKAQSDQEARTMFSPVYTTWVECPACRSKAFLEGEVESTTEPIYEDGGLYTLDRCIGKKLKCQACGLVLGDLAEIQIAGIEPHFDERVEVEYYDSRSWENWEEYNNM